MGIKKHRPPPGVPWEDVVKATAGKKPARYHPTYSSDRVREELELRCVRQGTELSMSGADPQTKRCFFMRMNAVIGASNGEETEYVFAEYLVSGEVHGRPITVQELRRKGAEI